MTRDDSLPYQLQSKIGEGSFGEVWLAHDPKRQEQIAVKFLRFDRKADDFAQAIQFFKREFELLCELRHLHLARVLDFGIDPDRDQYYFSTEFVSGKTLLEAIQNQALDYFEEILVQILSALDYVHSQGIIHFDIKPENILVEARDGRPLAKLLDFGVAGRLNALPHDGVGGTPAYMAPELFSQNPRLDHRVDLYSLGMLCMEALTGGLPFDRNSPKAASEWHLRGKIPDTFWKSREIPPYLVELAQKLTAKKASDRFSNARVVLNFLNLATSGKYKNIESKLQSEVPREGPLVERREGTLDKIQEQIESLFSKESVSGSSPTLYLCGERGIGKTRILEEIRQIISLKDISCFHLTCDYEIPSWPRVAELLELESLGHDNPDENWQIRRRADLLRQRAEKSPFCLLVDDFHKTDRDLKQTLLRLNEGGEKNIFIAVATEENLPDGLELKRLSQGAVQQYAVQVLGKSARIEEVAQILFQYSGGLPLLMVEGLRYLAPFFYRGEPLEKRLPAPGIEFLYHEKLQALPPQQIEIVQTVALTFRPIREAELLETLKLSPEQLAEDATPAEKSGLLNRRAGDTPGEWVYEISSQALALDMIERMDPGTRTSLHQKIANGLNAGKKAPLEEIAYHLSKAGQVDHAAKLYQEAAKLLKSQGQISNATKALGKSIKLLPEASETWREQILEIIQLLISSGVYSEAESYLNKIAGTSHWRLAELKGRLAFKRRNFPLARECYQEALKQLGNASLIDQIQIENALGNIDLQDGRTQEAVTHFQHTLQLEKDLPQQNREKFIQNNLGLAEGLLGDWEGAIHFFEDRIDEWEGIMTLEEEIPLWNGKGYVCLQSGRYEEAISCLKKAMLLAEQTGAMHSLSSIMGNLITALLKESRYAESLPLLQKIVDFQQRLGSSRDVSYNLLRQGTVYLTLGMGEVAKQCFQEGRKIFSKNEDPNLSLWYLLVEGYWEREYGDPKKAEQLFQEMGIEAEKLGQAEIHAWGVYAQADLAFEQNEIEKSLQLLESIRSAVTDKEFLARFHLLEAKTIAARNAKQDAEGLFANVENECIKGHFKEILWELYHDWGLARKKRQGDQAAATLFQQGVQVVETIVNSLPEEYRDRYLNQRMRKQLFLDYETAKTPAAKGMMSRLKSFIKEKVGPLND